MLIERSGRSIDEHCRFMVLWYDYATRYFVEEHAMRTQVTEHGVTIPKAWLEGIAEVEMQKEHNLIIVVPVHADDAIRALGKQPIRLDIEDASSHHDGYLYDR